MKILKKFSVCLGLFFKYSMCAVELTRLRDPLQECTNVGVEYLLHKNPTPAATIIEINRIGKMLFVSFS